MIWHKLNSVLFVLFANLSYLAIPIILISNLSGYFWWRFSEHAVYANFKAINISVLQHQFQTALDYLNFRNPSLDPQFFSREDIIHMQDVRNLMLIVYVLAFVSLMYLLINLISIKLRQDWLKNSIWSLIIYILILVIVGLPFLFNFQSNFILFHELLFTNEYWLLDPATSNLIKYLPAVIFQEILLIILLSSAGLSVLNSVLALFFSKFRLK